MDSTDRDEMSESEAAEIAEIEAEARECGVDPVTYVLGLRALVAS